ncbi:MAG: hypothetical protein M0R80_01840 [Proteobacteria bacterium]|jgi:hypothetical protein|nr:hypothetical protein [Pseudomonadota bacterium]
MFWVYVLIGFFLALVGGVGMLFALIMGAKPDPSIWKMIAVFLLPALGYWMGLIGAFLYGLGEAFKGG